MDPLPLVLLQAGIFLVGVLMLAAAIECFDDIEATAKKGHDRLMNWFKNRRETRIARIEADLDRTQDELRRTILRLAEALGAEAHEARRALIRESYLASGQPPERPAGS